MPSTATQAPRRGERSHVRQRSPLALLLIDVMHDFECEDGEELHVRAQTIVAPLRRLRARMRAAQVPIVYVNDNFGHWRSSFDETVRASTASARGDVARRLRPSMDCLAVLKPGRSGFYASPLELLLEQIGANTLVLTGLTTDQCVLATAGDAVLRKYRCIVPPDCCAALTVERHERAITLLREALGVDTTPSDALDLPVPAMAAEAAESDWDLADLGLVHGHEH